MQFKSLKKKFLNFLGKHFSGILIKVLCNTLRIQEEHKKTIIELGKNDQNFVLAFWHGKMLVPWFLFRETNSAAIISGSKDGNILADILTRWKYDVKRGSSSKGGKEVLEELISEAEKGKNILITPDGPRGPINKMKAGVVVVAKKNQIPIVLIGVCYNKNTKLKSWDKFEIPWFFSKVKVIYSEPYFVEENLSFEETGKMINYIEGKLINLESETEKLC